MNEIRHYFESITTLTDKEWDIFSSKLEPKSFRKKALVLKCGQPEHYLSFIVQGMVRYYFPDVDNEVTFAFAFEKEFVSAYDSFLTRQPSDYCVQALTDTTVWRISYEDLQRVYAETTVGDRIGRFAAEQLYLDKSKREHSLLMDTAEERYLKLLAEQAKLIQYIPMKYLASYIGITPQALSRIRKRIS